VTFVDALISRMKAARGGVTNGWRRASGRRSHGRP
jgi:hypothetical protein